MNTPRATPPSRRARWRRPPRRRFVPEPLEPRHLLAVALPGITGTTPADGATLSGAPQSFTITFDQSVVDEIDSTFAPILSLPPDQVFPTLIAFDQDDVEIDQVGPDGTLTPYAGGPGAAVNQTLQTTTAPDGTTTGTQLVVTLPAGDPTMQPGNYQLEVLPYTLMAMAFGTVSDPTWDTAPGPIPIADFTVSQQGPTLADATNLGTVGAQGSSFWSSLDPSDVQSAVALYKFTLPQGGPWQINAGIAANSLGSPLTTALALFDADGNVIATRNTGTGSVTDPVDPEIFQDLPAGTYYLGVSAAGNLPGTPAGYNPVTGQPGTAGTNQPAGLYELTVSATPVQPPDTLVGFNLDHADPLEPAPTGMDLTFSAPVDVSPLARPDQVETALTVVDASGQTWPISAVDYDSADNRLSFVFDEALPAGTYSLVEPLVGGLTDLAGRPVVGPSGSPDGVLATWTVAASSGPVAPNDLGVLWPGPENVTWTPGVSGSDSLAAGQQASYRFVAVCPGIYEVQTQVGAGSIDVGIQSADGASIVQADGLTGISYTVFHLEPGVYDLTLAADGSQPASVDWRLQPVALDYEKLANNGVGQTPALTLALVGPVAGESGASANTGVPGPSSDGTTVTIAGPIGSGSSGPAAGASAFTASPLPPALLVTPETGLAGMPTANGWQTGVVGPMAEGAMAALADAGHGLPAGLHFQASPSGNDPTVGEEELLAVLDATPTATPTGDEPAPGSGPGSPGAESARADAMALARAEGDPMVRIAGWIAGRIPGPVAQSPDPEIPAADFSTTLLAAATPAGDPGTDGTTRDRSRAALSQADLGLPVVLLVGTVLTHRLSQPVRRWWRRHHVAHPTWPRPYGFARAGRAVRQETC